MRVRFASMVVAAAALAAAVATAGCSPTREEPSTVTVTTASAAGPTTTARQPTQSTPQPTSNRQVIMVAVAGGKVTPAPATVDVKLGSVVVIEVTADVTDEIHVHGYDITRPLAAGQPGRVEVQATIPGQFDVELEVAHLLLVQLRVR